jgi:hypothetical protein
MSKQLGFCASLKLDAANPFIITFRINTKLRFSYSWSGFSITSLIKLHDDSCRLVWGKSGRKL